MWYVQYANKSFINHARHSAFRTRHLSLCKHSINFIAALFIQHSTWTSLTAHFLLANILFIFFTLCVLIFPLLLFVFFLLLFSLTELPSHILSVHSSVCEPVHALHFNFSSSAQYQILKVILTH